MMDWEAFYNSFRKPDFIPGYEIQNRLGGGAFGDVYKARKQSIGKSYAIKFLKIEDDGQREAVERELTQVRHFAAIDHPNLVTIEDMGTAMGVPYLIMGYAGEDTLARRLKAGRLERDEALLFFTQACRGVLALHDRRLVHFDLKPSNVFLKGDVARVGDYGLSKLLTDGRMTLSFGRGTPQYMAPEILRNRADHRADVYSLGVILYECLCGELPFEPEGDGGLVIRERDEPPAFPEDFPAVLRPPVERCLRLDPAHRFQQMGELLEALGQTARQGDSVRVDWDAAPAGGRATEPSGAGETPPTPGSTQEIRRTAADLARGAVEVARGVWDGIRAAKEDARGEDGSAQAPSSSPSPGTTLEGGLATLDRELEDLALDLSPGERDLRLEVGGGVRQASRNLRHASRSFRRGTRAATVKARALVAGLRRRRRRGRGEPATGFPAVPSTGPLAPPAPGGGTVPVPPRVEGGLLGTLLSSAVVALEVLVAMLGNLLGGILRLFRFLTEHLLRRSGGVLVRTLRLFVFLGLMVALGFTVMTVGMVFLNAVGMEP